MTNPEPGRELDAWLAVHLFGDQLSKGADWDGERFLGYVNVVRFPDGRVEDVPHYSTTWEGMRLVVEGIAKLGWWLEELSGPNGGYPYQCALMRFLDGRRVNEGYQHAPGAVALAAKAAIGGDDAQD